jgi:hypothetical protein
MALNRAKSNAAALAAVPTQSATPTADGAPRSSELITPAQAADLLRVRAKVLERWRGTGEGPAFVRLSSKTIRYRREDIDAFVAGRVRASTAAA